MDSNSSGSRANDVNNDNDYLSFISDLISYLDNLSYNNTTEQYFDCTYHTFNNIYNKNRYYIIISITIKRRSDYINNTKKSDNRYDYHNSIDNDLFATKHFLLLFRNHHYYYHHHHHLGHNFNHKYNTTKSRDTSSSSSSSSSYLARIKTFIQNLILSHYHVDNNDNNTNNNNDNKTTNRIGYINSA